MVSVELRPSADGQSFDPTPPRELFAVSIRGGGRQSMNFKFQYAVSPDGEKFLINEPLDDVHVPPLTVVLNWKPPS